MLPVLSIGDHLPDPEIWERLTTDVRRLITGESHQPEQISTWLNAFHKTGATLNSLTLEGTLTRGVRAVIAHQILFRWNQIGLSYRMQAATALATKEAVSERPTGSALRP